MSYKLNKITKAHWSALLIHHQNLVMKRIGFKIFRKNKEKYNSELVTRIITIQEYEKL